MLATTADAGRARGAAPVVLTGLAKTARRLSERSTQVGSIEANSMVAAILIEHAKLASLSSDRARNPSRPEFDFQNADLRALDLFELGEPIDLGGYNFAGSIFGDAPLQPRADQGVSLRGADLSDCVFAVAHMRHADLTGAKLEGTVFRGTWLNGACFDGATLISARFDGIRADGTTWRGTQLRDVSFGSRFDPSGVVKNDATAGTSTNATGIRQGFDPSQDTVCNLVDSAFYAARLIDVSFNDAVMHRVKFGADTVLENCRFLDCSLLDADFRGARLLGTTKLGGAGQLLTGAVFASAHEKALTDFNGRGIGASLVRFDPTDRPAGNP
ncbi:Serine/threonine-protein kinase B [Planctomycetes bacterium Pla86]|uniref:Serine/threonine-protein kinase B n=2 Tax=Engelhardtia mirabilis TaxID=2528011 RepID=A0A518BS90_9BACT|nr:Serine/threonine-protein kinase B [Planctomycetes bacterium Pla133]QDV04165.1 Serine/threonine-protein kinase B [Planctomycetes bacterium Pla86]